jgi:hypothetical protein
LAPRHGKAAALTLNTKDLSTFMENLDISFDVDQADTTAFGSTWKSSISGIPSGKLEFSGFYDPTAVSGPGAVLFPLVTAGTATTALVYPGGTASGQVLYTITSGCIVTSYSESSSVGGVVAFKASCDIVVLPVRTVV